MSFMVQLRGPSIRYGWMTRNRVAGPAGRITIGLRNCETFLFMPIFRIKVSSVDAPPNPIIYDRERVQNNGRGVTINRSISKKMMKAGAELRVEYQCMPRFAGAECRCEGFVPD
jgi:hypothetical protein